MNDTPRPEALPMPAEHPPRKPSAVSETTGDTREPDATRAKDDIEGLRAERDEYVDALQRLTAEFDNYRKRMLREQTAHVERAEEGLLRRLLPVLDAAELGAGHHPDVLGPVHRQLQQILAAEGLQRIEPTGAPFDPVEHQAVEHDEVTPLRPSEADEQAAERHATVTGVLRPGYRFHGRLLRPALVRVHT